MLVSILCPLFCQVLCVFHIDVHELFIYSGHFSQFVTWVFVLSWCCLGWSQFWGRCAYPTFLSDWSILCIVERSLPSSPEIVKIASSIKFQTAENLPLTIRPLISLVLINLCMIWSREDQLFYTDKQSTRCHKSKSLSLLHRSAGSAQWQTEFSFPGGPCSGPSLLCHDYSSYPKLITPALISITSQEFMICEKLPSSACTSSMNWLLHI